MAGAGKERALGTTDGGERRAARRRPGRRVAAAAGVAILAFVGYRALFVYDLTTAECPPAARPMSVPAAVAPRAATEIRVLSYNIGGHTALLRRRHVETIARLITELRPDVVGLQEVHRRTWQARFRDQANELAARTGMSLGYGPSFRVLGGEFGNAVLVRGRVLASEVVPLPSFGEPRTALRAAVEIDGFELDVWVTHLTAWGALNRRTRAAQTRCLADQIGSSRRPFLLVGDLNAGPEATELACLLDNDRMRLFGIAGDVTHAALARRLDYVFGDPRFEVLEARVLREGPSDHWPVLARLRWPGEG